MFKIGFSFTDELIGDLAMVIKVFSRGHFTCLVCILADHFEHRISDVSGMERQKQKIATPKLWQNFGE
uniref:hypothetical protein n=2 Tax=Lactobacillaceae TaxID=33958 RepID=UPI0020A773BE|nr:hypothetical protein [Lactiplantibacillus pentosus]